MEVSAGNLGAIRLLQAAIKQREVDERIELDDAQVTAIVEKQIKQRRDSIEQYEKAGRPELAAKEAAEIAVIEVYLPQAATADEIGNAVESAIADTGAASMKDMGHVMKAAMQLLAGKTVDGKAVSETVKAKLQ